MEKFWLERTDTALLLIDVQEKLFKQVDRQCEVIHRLHMVIQGMLALEIPIFVTEQYPEKLGGTLAHLKGLLGPTQAYLPKTSFSCLENPTIRQTIEQAHKKQWILVGIESHVCVLQTAKSMIDAGYQVTVLNDAITSRSVYDFSTSIAEMRDYGARISSMETILFELVKDSRSPYFKPISQLIQSCASPCCT